MHKKSVAMERVFKAPPSLLFDLWTKEEHFAKWWGPEKWEVLTCSLDLRPKGEWTADLRTHEDRQVTVGGVYLEVDPGRKLSFSWTPQPEHVDEPISTVTIWFDEHKDGTHLRLVHEKLGSERAIEMDAGWEHTFISLDAHLEELAS